MGYYDESRVRLGDGVTVRTLPGQDGVTDDSGWRRDPLEHLDEHLAAQEADREQTAERIGSLLPWSEPRR